MTLASASQLRPGRVSSPVRRYVVSRNTPASTAAVVLNRAVAVTERDGPAAGLAALDAVTAMARSHLWHAARAEALRRLGATRQAADALRQALELAPTAPERRLLARRLAQMPPH